MRGRPLRPGRDRGPSRCSWPRRWCCSSAGARPDRGRGATPASSSGTASAPAEQLRRAATTSRGCSTTRSSSATCGAALILIVLSLVIQLPVVARPGHAAQPAAARARRSTGCCSSPRTCCPRSSPRCCSRSSSRPTAAWPTRSVGWVGLGDLAATGSPTRTPCCTALFFVISWKYFGFHMILYLAGRQGIPQELTEAATTDGASPWQVFRHDHAAAARPDHPDQRVPVGHRQRSSCSTWSGCSPAAARSTPRRPWPSRCSSGFRRFEVGYASAISMVMFLISLVFALLYQRSCCAATSRAR